MHRMHRIFQETAGSASRAIRRRAPDHRPSRLPVPEPLVLFILCILCIDVHKNCRFPGAVAVRSKWRRGPDGAGLWCGRDARAPGWAFSHHRVTPRGRNCRNISGPAVIEGGPSVFVSIRVHWWFVFSDDPLFHSRMIHPVVGGGGGSACPNPVDQAASRSGTAGALRISMAFFSCGSSSSGPESGPSGASPEAGWTEAPATSWSGATPRACITWPD